MFQKQLVGVYAAKFFNTKYEAGIKKDYVVQGRKTIYISLVVNNPQKGSRFEYIPLPLWDDFMGVIKYKDFILFRASYLRPGVAGAVL